MLIVKQLSYILKTLLLLLAAVGLFGCMAQEDPLINKIREIRRGATLGGNEIEKIKSLLPQIREELDKRVQLAEGTVALYEVLAHQLMERKQYYEALESLKNALEYSPANENLYYLAGICAAQIAGGSIDTINKNKYLDLAIQLHQQAYATNREFHQPVYALAVLYFFELGDDIKAENYINILLDLEPSHLEGNFLAAQIYYIQGRGALAVGRYDAILRLTKDPEVLKRAEELRSQVMESLKNEDS